MAERSELIEQAESLLLGIRSEERDRIITLLAAIFEKIPEDDRNILLNMRNIHILLPFSNCSTEQTFARPINDKDHMHHELAPIWHICLPSDMVSAPKTQFIYSVVHEFAHAFLEHGSHVKDLEERRKRELEADQKVIEWGFEEELKACPFNYIYGEGLRNTGLV